ncbi:UDP-glucose:undecaprenyl-phosphate glucose-1-phosphate transferase [bacterium BMS3Abin05]|nr:UDP-glucose:undecaprenyl-phosphate glucose-1-phosphate transferase [bacterium BMS3Abin05]GBE28687.1 UDP-glucose:undecaprenyl-phosphate glucose-1-phosphate transferase [bacterium BMS3Bbin03]HDZ10933.1 sugar transferase [Bacteroidota bacterium]
MPKPIEKILLFLSDFITINASFFGWALIRQRFGFDAQISFGDFWVISGLIFLFWLFVFIFFGLYRSWYAQSRFDEFIALFKAVSIGIILIFLFTIDWHHDVANPFPLSRLMILTYWLVLLVGVSAGRMALRSFQRKLLESGVGLRKTVIVGQGNRAKELKEKVERFPALGYQLAGFVNPSRSGNPVIPQEQILGNLNNLEAIVQKNGIEEILIALEESERSSVVDILGQVNGLDVHLKIVPDLYDIVVGQARTNQIYGFPLIEILPELMPLWERRVKRLMDLSVSAAILVLFAPIWVFVGLIIKIESKGPVLYKQTRVGRNGKPFTMVKFRSMYRDAEKTSGPVWAGEDDPRITHTGWMLRKLRIDEVPQFINVFKGDMSLIGPRPERPYFVEKLKKEIPFYSRRLRIRPGITGWAQIKHEYDQSLDDVRKKVQYDLFYLENMSLRMDLKILLNTISVMLRGKGQ